MIHYDNNIAKINNRIVNYPGYAKPSEIEGLLFETDGFDKSSMFQNTEGTIPVGEGDPVRRMNAGNYYFTAPANSQTGVMFENNVLTFYNNNYSNVILDSYLNVYPALNGVFTDGVTSYTMFTLDVLQDPSGWNIANGPFLYLSQNGLNPSYNGFRMNHVSMGIPREDFNNLNFSAQNIAYTQLFFNTVRYDASDRSWEGWQNGIKTDQTIQTFEPFSTTVRFRIIYRRRDSLNYYRKHYKLLLYNRALSDEEVMLVNNYLGVIKNSHLIA